MQSEASGKALRMGRDFALKFCDIPEQAGGMAWPKSINTYANSIPTAQKVWEFLKPSSLSGIAVNWEVWRNDSGMAGMHRLRKALEDLRVPAVG